MKPLQVLKIALVAVPLVLASCGTKKKVVEKPKPVTEEKIQETKFLQKVNDNAQFSKFITSKVKFQIQVGAQDMTLTGNLKMKRDDVIRLQLMAFGFVEAGRLEFTTDYVLIMDRINKQYIKASYEQLDFLRNSGLNFYSLQALFWNELFMPGQTKVTDEVLKGYSSNVTGDEVVITYSQDKMNYKWLAEKETGRIDMANVIYKDRIHGQTQLNWDYSEFTRLDKKLFPQTNKISFTSPKSSEVKIKMVLNYLEHESEWETRTNVSSKYTQVSVSEILRRFMAL